MFISIYHPWTCATGEITPATTPASSAFLTATTFFINNNPSSELLSRQQRFSIKGLLLQKAFTPYTNITQIGHYRLATKDAVHGVEAALPQFTQSTIPH
jgi:hypothetical protein